MKEEMPIPYTDYLFIEPIKNQGVIQNTLNTYAKVLAIGKDVKYTKVGDIVAFEVWDKPDFEVGDKTCHFVRESEAICLLPQSWI